MSNVYLNIHTFFCMHFVHFWNSKGQSHYDFSRNFTFFAVFLEKPSCRAKPRPFCTKVQSMPCFLVPKGGFVTTTSAQSLTGINSTSLLTNSASIELNPSCC